VAALVAGNGMLFASACASLVAPSPPESPPVATIAPPPTPPPAPPHPARKPAPTVLAALPPGKTPPGADGFGRLQGLDQTEAVSVLGEPQQRVEAPPAVLWRYAGRDCELDVYFYLDLQSREMRILHYEVRNNDASERSQQRCYGELVTARHAGETGSADRPR
jgi:hypothetical protein